MAAKAVRPGSSAQSRAARVKSGSSGSVKPAKRTRGTGASYVYDSLKAQILDLELKPGTLLDETVVSRQFGVSRSPVREDEIDKRVMEGDRIAASAASQERLVAVR